MHWFDYNSQSKRYEINCPKGHGYVTVMSSNLLEYALATTHYLNGGSDVHSHEIMSWVNAGHLRVE